MRRQSQIQPSWHPRNNSRNLFWPRKTQFLASLQERWISALFFLLCGIVISVVFCLVKPLLYQSEGSIEIISSPLGYLDASKAQKGSVTREELATHLHKFYSRDVAEKVFHVIELDGKLKNLFKFPIANNFILRYKFSGLDDVGMIQNLLDVTTKDGLIKVYFSHPNRDVACQILDTYLNEYKKYQSSALRSINKSEYLALKGEEERLLLNLKLSEAKLSALASQNAELSLSLENGGDEADLAFLSKNIVECEKTISDYEVRLSIILPLIKDIEKLKSINFINASELVVKARDELYVISSNLEQLKVKYGPKHPLVIQATENLREAKVNVENSYTSTIVGLEANWRAAKTNLSTLRERQRILTDKTIKDNRIRQEYNNVNDEFKRLKLALSKTQSLLSNNETNEGGEFSPVKIVSLSDGQAKEIGPNWFLSITTGIISSFIVIATYIGALTYIDVSVVSTELLPEITNVPILGHVARQSYFVKDSAFDMQKYVSSNLKISYDKICTRLTFGNTFKKSQSILVTSSTPSEGKSFSAINLALTFSMRNERVLLIDADCRLPTIASKLQVSNKMGLMGYLDGSLEIDQIIQKNVLNTLDVIVSGGKTRQSSKLLNSSRLEELLLELGTRYDRIIIDTPPTLSVGDAYLIVPYVQGVVFVAGKRVVKRNTLVVVNYSV